MRLANLSQYIALLDSVTDNVRNNIINGYNCTGCNNCATRYKFKYKGKSYVKCALGNFYVYNPRVADIPSIKLLLEAEMPFQFTDVYKRQNFISSIIPEIHLFLSCQRNDPGLSLFHLARYLYH